VGKLVKMTSKGGNRKFVKKTRQVTQWGGGGGVLKKRKKGGEFLAG